MFESYLQSTILPLIIVCDEKDIVYANYLIQLIGQKDDSEDSFPEKVGNRMERKRSIKESDWHLRKRRESNVSKKPKKAPRSTHVKSPKRKNATNL